MRTESTQLPRAQMNNLTEKSCESVDQANIPFYACLFYFFIEYFRPQEKYSIFKGIPLGKISAILFLLTFILEGRKLRVKNRLNILILIYFLWAICCSITGINFSNSYKFLTDFGKLILMYFLTINTINHPKQLFQFVFFICLMYFTFTNFALRQWVASGFHVGFRGMWVGSGFFQNPNDMGCALSSFFGVSFYMIFADKGKLFGKFKKSWFHILNTLLFVFGTVISGARLAALGLGSSLLYIWAKNGFRIRYGIIGAILVLIYILSLSPEQVERFKYMGSKEDSTAQERIDNWKIALKMMKDYPVFGVGPWNYVQAKEDIYGKTENLFVQHNIFFQASTELGYPGLILLLLIIATFYRNMSVTKKSIVKNHMDKSYLYLAHGLEVGVLGFMVSGFFITTLYYPFLWVNLMIATALFNAVEENRLSHEPIKGDTAHRSSKVSQL